MQHTGVMSSAQVAANAANTISEFVSHEQIRSLSDLHDVLFGSSSAVDDHDSPSSLSSTVVVVLCASAVLCTAETVLSWLRELVTPVESPTQSHSIVLVLCGGIGHSTQLMHEAVRRHPRYNQVADQIHGLPEERILQVIAERFFHLKVHDRNGGPIGQLQGQGLVILVEDASTNCALNAKYTRQLLDSHGLDSPRSFVVAQDPTMCRRTVAAFEHVYADKQDKSPLFASWPTFVPRVAVKETRPTTEPADLVSSLDFVVHGMHDNRKDCLWSMNRFLDLLVGEIPRMRDDESGYGPRGKGSIVHVDIPLHVEDAWKTLGEQLGNTGRTRIA
ncbi:hypothetical protein FZEAL_4469 [Fusarium zealandicum]|uniref:DUF218 domain-containing protein n=1 Tax=Fusarium zealandicum TaxID=1053134 RepID=A0A8H4XKS4_9HYPO|nr:hypothetical protein FZEAL_4469 [Fusarium zealandicum]